MPGVLRSVPPILRSAAAILWSIALLCSAPAILWSIALLCSAPAILRLRLRSTQSSGDFSAFYVTFSSSAGLAVAAVRRLLAGVSEVENGVASSGWSANRCQTFAISSKASRAPRLGDSRKPDARRMRLRRSPVTPASSRLRTIPGPRTRDGWRAQPWRR
jgi:hypothetical protein